MILSVIKKTGSDDYSKEIDPVDSQFKLYLGNDYKEITINKDFSSRNIIALANPYSYETGLEPNIFVVAKENAVPCEKIIFGNCLFLKKDNANYIDLSDEDINFIHSYCTEVKMNDNEKAMSGLFEYDPKIIGLKFNKKSFK